MSGKNTMRPPCKPFLVTQPSWCGVASGPSPRPLCEDTREKKESDFDKLTKDEEQTCNELEDTVGRFNTENAIKKALIAEDERKEENRIRKEKERELKEAAALKVQAAWAWHKKYGPPPKKKKKKKK